MFTRPINPRARAGMKGRRAHSLIELVAVLGASTVVVGVATGLLLMLVRLERGARVEVAERAAVMRLADQFRRDAHAADRLAPSEDDQGAQPAWQFRLQADRVVEYRAEPDALVRVERAGGEVVGRESFGLSELATVSIDSVGDPAPAIVRLSITPGGDRLSTSIGRGLRIDAQLAKDRRFVKQNQP